MLERISTLADASRLDPVVERCHARVAARMDDPRLDAELRPRLCAYWDKSRSTGPRRPGTLLPASLNCFAGMFLLVTLDMGRELDDAAIEAAAACELYGFAISLLDAVQDDELEPPISELGPAVASNAALLMFVQACDGIMAMAEPLPHPRRVRVRRCFVQRSLISGAGQHRDLRGRRPATLEEAAAQAEDKTTTIPMIAELAALVADAPEDRVARYYRLGRRFGRIRQCTNDLRDLYGKRTSGDLATGKWNLPLAAAWSAADGPGRRELERLRAQGPSAADAIRQRLFRDGAIERVATLMERARLEIHAEIDALGGAGSPIAVIGEAVDLITSRLYSRTAA